MPLLRRSALTVMAVAALLWGSAPACTPSQPPDPAPGKAAASPSADPEAPPQDSPATASEAEPKEEAPVTPESPAPVEVQAPFLLMVTGESAPDQVFLQTFTMGKEPLGPRGQPVSGPKLTLDYRMTKWAAPMSHDGRGASITLTRAEETTFVHYQSPNPEESRRISLGDIAPVALHLTESAIYVGAHGELGWIDLSQAEASYAALVQRANLPHKPYDLFAQHGRHLVAIDDRVMPVYADFYHLDEAGRPTHLAEWELPGIINGHYNHAVLVPRGATGHTLYVTAPYGIRTGSGQIIAALPIDGARLDVPERLVLNGGRSADAPPVLIEHVSRMGKEPSLLSGESYTPWTGLAVAIDATTAHPRLVFLAAGERGLWVLPPDLSPEAAIGRLPLAGPCLDVVVYGDDLYALVGGDAPQVVHFVEAEGQWQEKARQDAPAGSLRFVR